MPDASSSKPPPTKKSSDTAPHPTLTGTAPDTAQHVAPPAAGGEAIGDTPALWPALLVDHRNCSAVMIILSQLYLIISSTSIYLIISSTSIYLINEGDNIAQFVDDPFEKSMFFAN